MAAMEADPLPLRPNPIPQGHMPEHHYRNPAIIITTTNTSIPPWKGPSPFVGPPTPKPSRTLYAQYPHTTIFGHKLRTAL